MRAQLLSAAPAFLGVEWGWQGLTWPGPPPTPALPAQQPVPAPGPYRLLFFFLPGRVLPPTAPLLAEGSGWLPPSQEDFPALTLSGRTSLLSPSQEDFPALTLSGGLPRCHLFREDFLLSLSQGGLPAVTFSGKTSCSHPLRDDFPAVTSQYIP